MEFLSKIEFWKTFNSNGQHQTGLWCFIIQLVMKKSLLPELLS